MKYDENLESIYLLLMIFILQAGSINVPATVCGYFDLNSSATW